MPAPGEDNLLTKEKEALARARRCEKCCWELSAGVSQKPHHLTTCAGWKSRSPRVIGACEWGECRSLGVRQWMSSVLGIENSTFKVRAFRDSVSKMPCRRRILVPYDSEATVMEKSST